MTLIHSPDRRSVDANTDPQSELWAFRPQLYQTALMIVGRPEDADDVVQETFVRAWQYHSTFQGSSKLSTWLTSICIRQACTFLRKKKRQQEIRQRSLKRRHPTVALDPENAFLQTVCLPTIVSRILSRMPRRDRELLLLHTVGSLYGFEIAHKLGLSRAAARTALHRARERFRSIARKRSWYVP